MANPRQISLIRESTIRSKTTRKPRPLVADKKLKIDEDSSSKLNKSSEAGYDPDSEYIRFHKQIHNSDGFDVDAVLPDDIVSYFGAYNDLNKVSPTQHRECEEFAREAIKFHNLHKKPENANLEYVKPVKFNMEFEFSPDGEMFYLTFEAKDTKDGSIQYHQAKVFGAYSKDPEVIPKVQMIRKKGESYFIGKDPKYRGPCRCQGAGPCGC